MDLSGVVFFGGAAGVARAGRGSGRKGAVSVARERDRERVGRPVANKMSSRAFPREQ